MLAEMHSFMTNVCSDAGRQSFADMKRESIGYVV